MAIISFPASPALNDEYTFEGRTWVFDGTSWNVKSIASSNFVTTSGGVLVGHLETIANATGNQVPRSSETVRMVGGAARIPNWTTAGRPASPSLGDEGVNTTLGCKERWDGSAWIPNKYQSSAVIDTSTGSSHSITNIPSYATEINLHLSRVSVTGTTSWLIQPGTSSGLVTSGYNVAASCDTSGSTLTSATDGVPVRVVSAINNFTGIVTFSREPSSDTWLIDGKVHRVSGEDQRLIGLITLAAPLDRVGISRGGSDTFDLGTIWATWK